MARAAHLLAATAILAQDRPLLPSANLGTTATFDSSGDLAIAGVTGFDERLLFQPPCLTGSACLPPRSLPGRIVYAGSYTRDGARQRAELILPIATAVHPSALLPLADGGFFLAVSTSEGQSLFRLDARLTAVWQRRIEAPNAPMVYRMRPQGDIVYTGYRSASMPGGEAFYLGRVTLTGDVEPSPLKVAGGSIALAPDGSVVLVGTTPGGDLTSLASTPGALQSKPALTICGGGFFGFPCGHQTIARVSGDLRTLHFVTWLTGDRDSSPAGAFVRRDGSIAVFGSTTSRDFPVTADAPIPAYPSRVPSGFRGSTQHSAAYLSIVSGDGRTLTYSTFLGGAGAAYANGLAAVGDDAVRLRGTISSNFPWVVGRTPSCAPFDLRLSTGATRLEMASFQLDFDLAARRPLRSVVTPLADLATESVDGGSRLELVQRNEPPAGFARLQGNNVYTWLRLAPAAMPEPKPAIHCLEEPATLEVQSATIAPGQIVAMYGEGWPFQGTATYDGAAEELPRELLGAQVAIDGEPAGLLYVSGGQINLAAPANLEPGSDVQAALFAGGVRIAERTLRVVNPRPAGFVRVDDPCLTPMALATFADGSPVTCDARAAEGDVVSLFVQGIGLDPERQRAGRINHEPDIAPPVPIEVERASFVSARPALGQPAGIWRVGVRMRQGQPGIVRVLLRVSGVELELPVWRK